VLCRGCGNEISVLSDACPVCAMDLTRVHVGRMNGDIPVRPRTAKAPVTEPAGIEVKVDRQGPYSLALFNAGKPLLDGIAVWNNSLRDMHDLVVTVELLPDYGRPWEKRIGTMRAKESAAFREIDVPISAERLLSVRESEKAWLKTEVLSDGSVLFSKLTPLSVLACNEWTFESLAPESLAGYVLPNNAAVEEIVGKAGPYLAGLRADDSFDGYQSGDRAKLRDMVRAVYLAMQKDLGLKYVNPPASFENESQKILLPGGIMDMGRGSCLDLALCFAGCVERMGLNPVIFLIPGHALLGVWMDAAAFTVFHTEGAGLAGGKRAGENAARSRFIGERYKKYVQLIRDEVIMPLNSITFTGDGTFERCVEEGKSFCSGSAEFEAVVDIAAVRDRVKPLPV